MKKLLLWVGLAGFTFNGFAQYTDQTENERKQQFEQFLRLHPYKNTPHYTEKQLKAIPKKDRPDLANQQNFIQTMDPNLGYPPPNGLINAHLLTDKITKQKMGLKTAISGISWTERGPDNVGGRTRALMFDPNDGTGRTVFAGGVAGGLWKNTNITSSSTQWTPINDFWDNLAVTSIAYDPSATQTMYAGTGEGFFNIDAVVGGGLWKSTNGGTSWTRVSSTTGSTFRYIQKVIVHPTTGDVYVATRDGGVQRSQNGGTSWTKVLGSGTGASTNRAADIEIGADGTIYAGMGMFSTDGIYSSANGNAGTWTKLNTGGNGFPTSGIRRIEIACAPNNANVIYCIVQDGGSALDDIYKSTNKGSTWSTCAKPNDADGGIPASDFTRGQAWYDLSIAVDPNNSNTLIVGGIDLFKSTNGGTSWTQISHWYGCCGFQEVHADQHAVVYKPGSSTEIIFGHDGGVGYSSNGSATTPTIGVRNNGYNVTQFYAGAINGTTGSNNMIAGAQDNGTHKYTTPGVNSTSEVTGGDGAFCHIDQSNGNNQISQYVRNVVYRTTNNWGSSSNLFTPDQSTGLFINPSDYDDKEDIFYSGFANGSSIRLKRVTSPFGSATVGTVTIASGSADVSHISASPYASGGNSTLFVGTDAGAVYKVTNAQSGSPGISNISTGLPAGNISCIAIGASEQQLLVTLSNYGVTSIWESMNGGGSWTNKEGNLPDMPVRWALYNPNDYNQALIATEVGVWSTDDLSAGSVDWDPTNTGLANVRTDMLQLRGSDNTVMAATHGRGVFTATIPATGVKPVAAFTGTPTTVCEGGNVNFTDQSTNSPTGWTWTFAGGTPSASSSQNPTVTYNTAGNYTVQLIATNASGSDTLIQTNYITVNAAPTPSTSSTNETCAGNDGTATANGGVSYLWDDPLAQTTPTATGLAAGTYNCTVTNAPGCITIVPVVVAADTCVQLTSLRTPHCGITLNQNLDNDLRSYPVSGATAYQYELKPVGGGPTLYYTRNGNHRFKVGWVPGVLMGKTYDIRVRAQVLGVWGVYGTVCSINTPGGPVITSALRPAYCGITLGSWSAHVRCKTPVGATGYDWILMPQPSGTPLNHSTSGTGSHKLWPSTVTGIQPSTTYAVIVRPIIGPTTGSYGDTCLLTTPSTPPMQGPPNMSRLASSDDEEDMYEMGYILLESSLYPNPNDGYEVTLDVRGLSNEEANVAIFDLSGRQIVAKRLSHADGHAIQTFRFNEVLTSGVYLVRISNGNRSQTKKLVIR